MKADGLKWVNFLEAVDVIQISEFFSYVIDGTNKRYYVLNLHVLMGDLITGKPVMVKVMRITKKKTNKVLPVFSFTITGYD